MGESSLEEALALASFHESMCRWDALSGHARLCYHGDQMTDTQILTIVLASAPTMLAVLLGILVNNSRLSDLRAYMDGRFGDVGTRFDDVNARFTSLERRLDELKEIWRSELHRVEEVLDARLKHLEER
jgi:hypothetical protein